MPFCDQIKSIGPILEGAFLTQTHKTYQIQNILIEKKRNQPNLTKTLTFK